MTFLTLPLVEDLIDVDSFPFSLFQWNASLLPEMSPRRSPRRVANSHVDSVTPFRSMILSCQRSPYLICVIQTGNYRNKTIFWSIFIWFRVKFQWLQKFVYVTLKFAKQYCVTRQPSKQLPQSRINTAHHLRQLTKQELRWSSRRIADAVEYFNSHVRDGERLWRRLVKCRFLLSSGTTEDKVVYMKPGCYSGYKILSSIPVYLYRLWIHENKVH